MTFGTTRRQWMAATGAAGLSSRLSGATWPNRPQRTVVVLFLHGGNDSANTIVPLDGTAYGTYSRSRSTLSIPQNSLLRSPRPTSTGDAFGWHPSLQTLAGLDAQGAVGAMLNIGLATPEWCHHRATTQWRDQLGGELGAPMPTHNSLAAAAEALVGGTRPPALWVDLDGFDLHTNQLARHAAALTQLDGALTHWNQRLHASNLTQHVTLVLASEFGRRLRPRGDGSDHGWAGHAIAIGGAAGHLGITGSAALHDDAPPAHQPHDLARQLLAWRG